MMDRFISFNIFYFFLHFTLLLIGNYTVLKTNKHMHAFLNFKLSRKKCKWYIINALICFTRTYASLVTTLIWTRWRKKAQRKCQCDYQGSAVIYHEYLRSWNVHLQRSGRKLLGTSDTQTTRPSKFISNMECRFPFSPNDSPEKYGMSLSFLYWSINQHVIFSVPCAHM